MSAFDQGDEVLIQQLIADGVAMTEIASKWDVSYRSLLGYCCAKGIQVPKRSPEKNGCHSKRIAVEKGLAKSATVQKIIELQPTHSVRDIAEKVKRSVEFVSRMIDVHIKKEVNNRHAQRVNAVRQLANAKDIPIGAACIEVGVLYNQYCYSARRIGLHGNKKAPA